MDMLLGIVLVAIIGAGAVGTFVWAIKDREDAPSVIFGVEQTREIVIARTTVLMVFILAASPFPYQLIM